MKLKLFGAVMLGWVVASCATSPVKVSQAPVVPTARLLPGFHELAKSGPNTAKVIVVRDAGVLGIGAKAKLLVDGAPVATIWSSERVEFFLKAGDHILAVVPEPQLMGALTENSVSISAGRNYYFRISISETSFRIQPTTQVR